MTYWSFTIQDFRTGGEKTVEVYIRTDRGFDFSVGNKKIRIPGNIHITNEKDEMVDSHYPVAFFVTENGKMKRTIIYEIKGEKEIYIRDSDSLGGIPEIELLEAIKKMCLDTWELCLTNSKS